MITMDTTSVLLFLLVITVTASGQTLIARSDHSASDVVQIECNSNNILVTLNSKNFNGMIYPKGLSKNSSCMVEYSQVDSVTYVLPLRACNTMSADVDGGTEYFNTVVVQPHKRLVTNQGKGYHIRCRYQTQAKTISNNYNTSSLGTTPVLSSAPMPSCSMKILMTESGKEMVAESVKIGDRLTLTIAIDDQDVYGMKVTNCLVRDGLNWGEQPLLNDEGCPIDDEIMGPFQYSHNKTRATVAFQAHKFPYTSSVYYQCNVRLCLKESGGCEDVPPDCEQNGLAYRRRRRDTTTSNLTNSRRKTSDVHDARVEDQERAAKDISVEVYSGLYVNEAEENEVSSPADKKSTSSSSKRPGSEEEFCISMRKFAIGVAIASILLMLAVVLLVVCILQRRRRRKGSSTASSVYSGPYSNRGYSRD